MAVNLSPIWGAGAQLFDNSGNVLSGGKIYTYAAGTTTPATTYTSSSGITANSNPIILNSAGRVPYEIWLSDTVAYKFVLKDSNDTLIATYDNLVGINSNFIAYTAQQEIQTATAGQTVFNLTTMQYQPSTNNLSVFVDGVNQYGPGAQYAYVETDSDTVTFVNGLHVGASVKFTTASPVAGAVMNAENVAYDPPFTGAVTTNVEAKLAQTVSVKDFGAVGDGVTNDTQAINDALSAVSTTAQSVYFPAGTYVYDGGGVLGDGVVVYGDGRNASIILKTNDTGTQFTCQGRGSSVQHMGFNASIDQTSGSYYVKLEGIEAFINDFAMTRHFHGVYMTANVGRILHGRLQYASPNAICIFAGGGDNSQIIDDVLLGAQETAPNIAAAGIKVSNSVALTITNSSVIQMGVGLFVESTSNTAPVLALMVTNCYFDNCNYGVQFQASGTGSISRVKFVNVWAGSAQATNADGISIVNSGTGITQGFDFVNCQCCLNTGSGLSIAGNASGYVGDVNVIGGQFSQNLNGIYVNNYVDRAKIIGASVGSGAGFVGNTNDGIFIAPGVSNLIIADNIIKSNTTAISNNSSSLSSVIISENLGYKTIAQGSAVLLSGTTSLTVTHGLSVTPTNSDIILSMASGLSGAGNVFPDSANATTFKINAAAAPSTNIAINWQIRTNNA